MHIEPASARYVYIVERFELSFESELYVNDYAKMKEKERAK